MRNRWSSWKPVSCRSTAGMPSCAPPPAPALTSPLALEDANVIARGKAVYFTFCAQCHGPNYDGNGTVGQSFMPLPTDFRTAAVQSKPAGDLFKSVSYGIPGGRQPPLETTITIDDRWSVVAFVKSLGLSPVI